MTFLGRGNDYTGAGEREEGTRCSADREKTPLPRADKETRSRWQRGVGAKEVSFVSKGKGHPGAPVVHSDKLKTRRGPRVPGYTELLARAAQAAPRS